VPRPAHLLFAPAISSGSVYGVDVLVVAPAHNLFDLLIEEIIRLEIDALLAREV
jgi:hypothetical protein